jgi:hypothetical protein
LNPSIPVVAHLVFPTVTSFTYPQDAYVEYKTGFTHPSELWPFARRAALTREIMPATTGAEALVPLTANRALPTEMIKPDPAAATSGYPRPDTA